MKSLDQKFLYILFLYILCSLVFYCANLQKSYGYQLNLDTELNQIVLSIDENNDIPQALILRANENASMYVFEVCQTNELSNHQRRYDNCIPAFTTLSSQPIIFDPTDLTLGLEIDNLQQIILIKQLRTKSTNDQDLDTLFSWIASATAFITSIFAVDHTYHYLSAPKNLRQILVYFPRSFQPIAKNFIKSGTIIIGLALVVSLSWLVKNIAKEALNSSDDQNIKSQLSDLENSDLTKETKDSLEQFYYDIDQMLLYFNQINDNIDTISILPIYPKNIEHTLHDIGTHLMINLSDKKLQRFCYFDSPDQSKCDPLLIK